jgi:hypothetical protein
MIAMMVTPGCTTYLQLGDGLGSAGRVRLEGHPFDEQVVEHRLDLLHRRRLEERPAQNRAELPRLVVAQFYRRGLVSTGVAAVDRGIVKFCGSPVRA